MVAQFFNPVDESSKLLPNQRDGTSSTNWLAGRSSSQAARTADAIYRVKRREDEPMTDAEIIERIRFEKQTLIDQKDQYRRTIPWSLDDRIAAMEEAARRLAELSGGMDRTPIDEGWLEAIGFQLTSMRASILIPPKHAGTAIVELSLTPNSGNEGWVADLTQGVPDDQHVPDDHVTLTHKDYYTRGEVLELCRVLGAAYRPSGQEPRQ